MAASPLIAAWAGLRPSHFELAREQSPVPGRPETGPPETAPATVALVALDRSPTGTGTPPPVQAGLSLARFDSTYWTLLQIRSRDPLLPQGLAEKSDRRQLGPARAQVTLSWS